MLNISFNNDPQTKSFILGLFNKKVDNENYIVEVSSGERVIDTDGNEITFDEFGVIRNGSEIFIKNNIVSLINFHHQLPADQ